MQVLTIAVKAIQDGSYNGLREVHLVAFQAQEVKATVDVVHEVIDEPIAQEQRESVKHALRIAIELRDLDKLAGAMQLAEQTDAFDHTASKWYAGI